MVLVDRNTGVIVDIVDTVKEVETGLLASKTGYTCIYAWVVEINVFDIEAPEGVEPQIYSYLNGEFIKN